MSDGDEPLLRRAASPVRALVPRPGNAAATANGNVATLSKIAAKYGIKTGESDGELEALREDRRVLLALYNKLLSEHAEVWFAKFWYFCLKKKNQQGLFGI